MTGHSRRHRDDGHDRMTAPSVQCYSRFTRILLLARYSLAFFVNYLKERRPLSLLFPAWNRYRRSWFEHQLEVEEFFVSRLWRPQLDDNQALSFIGWRKHAQVLLALNPLQYRCVTGNKLVFHNYCTSINLPVPKLLGVFDRTLKDAYGVRVFNSAERLRQYLSANSIESIIIKPIEGTRGQSILALDLRRDGGHFRLPNGDPVSDTEIENALSQYSYRGAEQTGFLVQVRLLPAESTLGLSSICPLSYRAITLTDHKGHCSIIMIYAKSATGRNIADNFEAGGLVCIVDSNGMCVGARSKMSGTELLELHPTTSFRLKGWQPPKFEEVADLALRAAAAFHFLKCIAWDIAVAREGVFLLEGNNPWSWRSQEDLDQGLWKGAFEREAKLAIAKGPSKSPWW